MTQPDSADATTSAATTAPPVARRRLRAKPLLLVAGILVAGVVFGVGTQTWITVTISGAPAPVTANATTAAPALSALALAQLALVGALALAGRVLRYVLGALQVLLGAVMALSVLAATGDPLGSAISAIAKATGVSGKESAARLVTDIEVSDWPWVALVGSLLFVVVGVAVTVTARSWGATSRRYETAPAAASGSASAAASEATPTRDGSAAVPAATHDADPSDAPGTPARPRTAVDDWDALNHGDDPTERD